MKSIIQSTMLRNLFMKNLVLISLFFLTCNFYTQDIKFKNSQLEKVILKKYPGIDINKNEKIEIEEALKVNDLNLMEENLVNVEDLIFFKNLRYLSLTINEIQSLKLKNFPHLEKLYCARNKLTQLEISDMPKLQELAFGINLLEKVTIKNCPNIESLNFMDNKINIIDLDEFSKLKYLSADDNKLTNINLSKNPDLIQFNIKGNPINEIDISKNSNLNLKILYLDEHVKIIGTAKQMEKYTPFSSPPPSM